jgi:hypothetical protein
MTVTERRRGTRLGRALVTLVSAGSLIAILALAASAQALTKFGSDLRNNDGSVTQPTAP